MSTPSRRKPAHVLPNATHQGTLEFLANFLRTRKTLVRCLSSFWSAGPMQLLRKDLTQ